MHPAIKAFIPILVLAIAASALLWQLIKGNPVNPDRIVSGDSLFYAQGPCFGACPVFEIKVKTDDSYRYDGQGFVGREGVFEGHFPEGRYRELITLLADYDFASFRDRYSPEEQEVCKNFATDMPSYDIRLTSRQLTKSLYYYEGCLDFADEARLKALVAALQQAIELDHWLESPE